MCRLLSLETVQYFGFRFSSPPHPAHLANFLSFKRAEKALPQEAISHVHNLMQWMSPPSLGLTLISALSTQQSAHSTVIVCSFAVSATGRELVECGHHVLFLFLSLTSSAAPGI